MINNGGSAFPLIVDRGVDSQVWEGISVRDYFAGQALSGLSVPTVRFNDIGYIAHMSYLIADAMLAEREKEFESASNS